MTVSLKSLPDARGYFGSYGGRFVPDTLVEPLLQLETAYRTLREDPSFLAELKRLQKDFVGRPTALFHAQRLSEKIGGAKLYLKREDLCHTGAHKINNAVGQILLAKRMGKTRIIAETGAGQHGVASAAAAALFGMECVVYMGDVDMARQEANVLRMRLLGARVQGVSTGSATLKDAVSEAMRDWAAHHTTTHYLLGSALGPHPYPLMVRDFQKVIGQECRTQILEAHGQLPEEMIACLGGGSNGIGLFYEFLDDTSVRLTGVEAGGTSLAPRQHAARFSGGRPAIFQGMKTYVLQDENGQIEETASISAGLDYAGVGPEHANLMEAGRVHYVYAQDDEALTALKLLCETEGIIPALESSHAIAHACKKAKAYSPSQAIVVNISGRGDKDMGIITQRTKQS